ncbi:MAG: efflux RND transporter periplasmic adaptor subunit [Candidatus Magasanikbacteria bacterium]|nr:efflux RND transporter periplasmic adaptor subunit [Candidatus Magasanikbacteria bacterium]
MTASLFKTKKFYVLLVVLAIAIFGYRSYRQKNLAPEYELATVAEGNLVQTVAATGKIESISDLALRFETAGTIERVFVREGASVAAGATLLSLRAADLDASVAVAEANLNQKLAGATESDIAYYRAAVDSAKAALQEAEIDVNATSTTGGSGSRIVSAAYAAALPIVQASLTKLDDGLTQADNILGIDNVYANETFRTALATNDNSKIFVANGSYLKAKASIATARLAGFNLSVTSPHSSIDLALKEVADALVAVSGVLTDVSQILKITLPSASLPQATLDAKKSIIETTRSAISTQYSGVIAQIDAIATAKSNLAIKQAAYDQAVANLNAKLAVPREVDVAYYRAQLAQALVNRRKASLHAPQSGLITSVPKKIGEYISTTDVAIKMLSPRYEVKVDISESDVAKLSVGQTAKITLDALRENDTISGTIRAIDPAATEIQDVVYYKVTIALADTDIPIKPGMTANVTIMTASRAKAFSLPLRSVRTGSDGHKFVKLLGSGGQVTETEVILGLRGDLGRVEILSGVNASDTVIISSSTKK